jgi:hypothetical protein
MIPYALLRERLRDWPKYPGCEPRERAPLLTAAFPGSFNMSFTEHHWLAELGGFLSWDRSLVFSTIQSCVRLGDFAALTADAGHRYLGVFELADLCGAIALAQPADYATLQGWQLAELIRLFEQLGIEPERIHASYSAGGPVAELTNGRYRFAEMIPPDHVTREALLSAGVPEANLLPDTTRATLLALHVYRPTPWGYRSEIFVDPGQSAGRGLLEVATAEYFLWRPRYRKSDPGPEDIVGLEPIGNGGAIVACGLERLAMVANGLARIHDVDYLLPYYETLQTALGRPLRPADYLAGESLRTLHRIYADLAFHPEARLRWTEQGAARMSIRRHRKLGSLKRAIPTRLGEAELEQLLAVHSRGQPWHPDLAAAIEPTIWSIVGYRQSRARHLVPTE